ncbi:hypothetical protein BJP34_34030 [Moorena producens PAL-8-15-08-1]|uniref:Uncharacterized protein n=1 Tax=Moorena producens PAL-8-15-08-1 TaxID=1458985 RepID=A0A1D8U271_9CYAN|nr:hypothetical protein [Moorena producens]AOX03786.1 hypothetical protein BJP34_34030 [Moorena producens PAL-8-15-08-1]
MNKFSRYTISTESPTQSNLRRLELLLEYCQLAARPTLSVSDTNRMAKILELAEADQILSLLIDKADLVIAKHFSWLSDNDIDTYKNQIAKLEEYLEIFVSQTSPETSETLRHKFACFTGNP